MMVSQDLVKNLIQGPFDNNALPWYEQFKKLLLVAVEVAELVQHLEMTGQGTGCLPLDLKINWGINFLLFLPVSKTSLGDS